ncbi:MAG: lecithin retinol acyltransferase family protein [Chitinophagaceae bacterium]|nr:lecithin retinol acyltransferase family protein [Chitinophagaceae bacterium]
MLDHFAVFLGYDNRNIPVFTANYTKGTKQIEHSELEQFLQNLEPQRIVRFEGNQIQRKKAVERALSKIGENNYSMLENNCEHYASYVQKGVSQSKQAESFKTGFESLGQAALVTFFIGAIVTLLDD